MYINYEPQTMIYCNMLNDIVISELKKNKTFRKIRCYAEKGKYEFNVPFYLCN